MAMESGQFARLLKNIALVDERACALVAQTATLERVPAGRTVVREGERGNCFYIIASGSVRVVLEEAAREVARLGEGNLFGEMAAVCPQPRSATVITTESCELIRFDGTALRHVVERYPALREFLFRVGLTRTEKNLQHIVDAQSPSPAC